MLSRAKALSAGFRTELHEEFPHLVPAWYAFRDARAHRRAVEWLGDNSLICDVAVARFLDEHPEPNAVTPVRRLRR